MRPLSQCLVLAFVFILLLCLVGTSLSLKCYECRSSQDCKKPNPRQETCNDTASYYDSAGNAKTAVCGTRSSGDPAVVFEAGCGPDVGSTDCKAEDCVTENGKKKCRITRCTCKADLCNTKKIVKPKDDGGAEGVEDAVKSTSASICTSLLLQAGCLASVLLFDSQR